LRVGNLFCSLLLSSVHLITSRNNSLGNFSMARGMVGIDVLAGSQLRSHLRVVEKYQSSCHTPDYFSPIPEQ
jgi:hypothetical protein